MIFKHRFLNIFLVLAICLGLGFSAWGCDDADDSGSPFSDTVSLKGNYEAYEQPGTKTSMYVFCEPQKNRPTKPVYVWRIFFNGNLIEEIVHDSEPKVEKKTEDTNSSLLDDEDTKYSWPNSDDLTYTWAKAGTYKIDVDLYDYEQYSKNKDRAAILSSHTHNVYCDNVRLSVEAMPTKNSREFTLKAILENPKFTPYGCPVKWEFTSESTGQTDNGPTEVVTAEYSLWDNGFQEVEHAFQNAGKYKAVFTIVGYFNAKPISAETIVNVSQELQIIVPAGPLRSGEEITFTARTDSLGDLSEAPSYEWYFGDGNGLEIPFSNEATHLYNKEGTYMISVKLFESGEEAAPLMGAASVEVTIEAGSADFLSYLQQTTQLLVTVRGDSNYHQSDGYTRHQDGFTLVINSALASTKWEGTHFKNTYYTPVTGSSSGVTLTIEGDVSKEGDKVYNLVATVVYDDAHRLVGEQRESRISVVNVQLEPTSTLPVVFDPNSKACFVAYIEGADVANYVNSTFYEHKRPQTSDPEYKMWYDSMNFMNNKYVPYLLIVFKVDRIDAYDDPGYQKRDT